MSCSIPYIPRPLSSPVCAAMHRLGDAVFSAFACSLRIASPAVAQGVWNNRNRPFSFACPGAKPRTSLEIPCCNKGGKARCRLSSSGNIARTGLRSFSDADEETLLTVTTHRFAVACLNRMRLYKCEGIREVCSGHTVRCSINITCAHSLVYYV